MPQGLVRSHPCSILSHVLQLTVCPVPGRTTFVNTLCGKTVLAHKESDDATSAHVEEGVKIKPVTVGMQTRYNLITCASR